MPPYLWCLLLVVMHANADDMIPQTCSSDDDCAENFSCVGEGAYLPFSLSSPFLPSFRIADLSAPHRARS